MVVLMETLLPLNKIASMTEILLPSDSPKTFSLRSRHVAEIWACDRLSVRFLKCPWASHQTPNRSLGAVAKTAQWTEHMCSLLPPSVSKCAFLCTDLVKQRALKKHTVVTVSWIVNVPTFFSLPSEDLRWRRSASNVWLKTLWTSQMPQEIF